MKLSKIFSCILGLFKKKQPIPPIASPETDSSSPVSYAVLTTPVTQTSAYSPLLPDGSASITQSTPAFQNTPSSYYNSPATSTKSHSSDSYIFQTSPLSTQSHQISPTEVILEVQEFSNIIFGNEDEFPNRLV